MAESRLSHEADRWAIVELLHRYCRSVDRLDLELGYSIWHEDSTADYGPIYRGAGRGVIDFVCAQHRNMLNTSHQITNVTIEFNGDRAGSEAYAIATLRMMRTDTLLQMTIWPRYIDRWSKRAGRWGIDERIVVVDFDEVREVQPISESDRWRRDQMDPSYAALGKVT
jgi:hypothetical protein